VRVHLPQQRLGSPGGCVGPLPRHGIRPLPGRLFQREVRPQPFQQLELLVGVGFESERVDLDHPHVPSSRTAPWKAVLLRIVGDDSRALAERYARH
jgi:hypothetical protein